MKYKSRAIDRGAVRFHHVGSVSFWLTPSNRIFLVAAKQVIWPRMVSGEVKFDDPFFVAAPRVIKDLHRMLRTQFDIRSHWPSPEEDEVAYDFSLFQRRVQLLKSHAA